MKHFDESSDFHEAKLYEQLEQGSPLAGDQATKRTYERLMALYSPAREREERAIERVRARLAQREASACTSLSTPGEQLEGKVNRIKEKNIMEEKQVSWGTNSSQPQAKKRGSLMRTIGVSLAAAAAIIAIVSFTIFSNVLRPAHQMATHGSSTLTGAAGQQQAGQQQKEMGTGKLVCTVLHNVAPPPPADTDTTNVYWSAQGRIATSFAGSLVLFSAQDCGAPIQRPSTSFGATWSPDGKELVESDNSALNIRDQNGTVVKSIPLTQLSSLHTWDWVWSSDGTKLTFLSEGADHQGSVKTIDVASGGNVKTLMTANGVNNLRELSPNGKYAFELQRNSSTKPCSILDVATGKKISDLLVDGGVSTIGFSEFSPDSSLFAASNNNKIEIYNVASGKLQVSIDDSAVGSYGAFRTKPFSWSPDGKYIAVSATSIGILDVNAQKIVTTFGQVGANHTISSVSWAPDDSGLVSATDQVPYDGHSKAPVNVWVLS